MASSSPRLLLAHSSGLLAGSIRQRVLSVGMHIDVATIVAKQTDKCFVLKKKLLIKLRLKQYREIERDGNRATQALEDLLKTSVARTRIGDVIVEDNQQVDIFADA
ncbi:MAG: hypothetical protein ABI193_05645 [Minicystis sp.]